ncbi:MAG: phosphoribosyltransferase family protein [Candidatus Saccharimonas sp.]
MAWCVGEKQQGLEQLVYQYKFDRAKAAYRVFAELLDATLPVLPIDMIVVPVPTISAHIRQRGYDHAALLTKAFAQRRGLAYDTMLVRRSNTVQLGKNRMQRRVQAEQAFEYRKSCDGKRFLIVDDIFTTGATAEFAARTLKAAGAEDVWVAVIAHQPLEKKAPSRYNDEKITTY